MTRDTKLVLCKLNSCSHVMITCIKNKTTLGPFKKKNPSLLLKNKAALGSTSKQII